MDKILLIDLHNALWRASIGFGPPKQKHELCSIECNHTLGLEFKQHCTCGQEWNFIDYRCVSQASEDFVLIYNFFRNLRPLIEQFVPDKCFCVLEGHPQFRYDLFADYKANRIVKQAAKKETIDKFHQSKREVIRLLQYLPVTIARAAKYECDDVIATFCENMNQEDVTVISNDSDYIQLLQKGYRSCKIYNPIKKEFMSAPEYPYVAWKCLNGDKSDNIPSILTPKKALNTICDPRLFEKFMSVEENRANFNINRQLIEFQSVPENEIEIQEGVENFEELKKEFSNMKFESMINEKYWSKFCDTFSCINF